MRFAASTTQSVLRQPPVLSQYLLVPVASLACALGALLLFGGHASAQCRPDDVFCAELRIGPRRAQPAPVVVEPAPVVVQPAPPPVVIVEPAPPPVVVQPAPPPVVVVQPAPVVQRPVVVQPRTVQPARYQRVVEYTYEPLVDLGVRLNLGMAFTPDVNMGGAGAAFRLRTGTHLAFDVVTGIYGGSDYQGQNRVEVPLMANALIFFNPEDRFQIYAVVGGGASFAEVNGTRTVSGTSRTYLGGEVGIGAELRLSRFFALNLDVRTFLRGRTGGGAPEFVEINRGSVRSTDASAGVYGTVGMTFYFLGMRTYR